MNAIKRPPTIWLTQSLLALFALMFLSILLFNLINLLRHQGAGFTLSRVVIGNSIIGGMVLLPVVAIWGLAKRKLYGKWLGLLSLILIWALLIFMQLRPPSGPYRRLEYDNPAQVAGAGIFHIFLYGLFLVLVLRLSFSKKVNDFFVGSEA